MTRNQLFTEVNKLCREMDYSYNINCGGCCFVAACLAQNLEKLNIPFEIIHFGLNGCHYCVKINDRYLNRDEYTKKEIVEVLNDSELLFERYYNSNWNSMYKRRWNLIVSTRINSLFKKYANCRT